MESNERYPGGPDGGQSRGATTPAQERASEVGQQAQGEASTVARQASEEARSVAHEARSEVVDVVDEARRVVHDEADKQTHALSSSVHQLAEDLQSMAEGATGDSMASDYVRRIGRSMGSMADRLDEGGIDAALDDLRQVARRSPGVFLAGAAATGFGVARVLRHADAPSAGDGATSAGAEGRSGAASSAPDEVDLRDEYRERPGRAPALENDMQEWARP